MKKICKFSMEKFRLVAGVMKTTCAEDDDDDE